MLRKLARLDRNGKPACGTLRHIARGGLETHQGAGKRPADPSRGGGRTPVPPRALERSPDAHGALIEPATLKIHRRRPGPIERVWAYLTESEPRRRWLAAGQMQMKVGAPFQFVWRNDGLPIRPASGRPASPTSTECRAASPNSIPSKTYLHLARQWRRILRPGAEGQ